MKEYFNKYLVKSSLLVAIFLSLPLYLIHFSIDFKLLNTILVIYGVYLLLKSDLKSYYLIGFFIGIFWFYWVSLSFRYYNLSFLIPFIIFGIGAIYGLYFWFISFLKYRLFIIIFFIFGFDYLTLFGFDWFKIDYLLETTYFGVWKINLILLFLGVYLFIKNYKELSFLFLFLALIYNENSSIKQPNLRIKLEKTAVPQNLKWNQFYIQKEIDTAFSKIEKAKKSGFDMVILPETVFPFILENQIMLINRLKELSNNFGIVVGSLSVKDNKFYNSTYIFYNGKIKILNKHILVPFGEYNPLPKFIGKIVNQIFFDGSEDYIPAKEFGKFEIKGVKFLNAICYEVTNEKIYKQKEKYIIAISNNAWFVPSIEPTLQNIIIKFYEKKYHKIVYHSVNQNSNPDPSLFWK